jgi:hypothetical protein
LINPTRGFKALPTVFATTKGLGAMRMIRKRNMFGEVPQIAAPR